MTEAKLHCNIVRGGPEDEQSGAGKEAVTPAQGEKEACSMNFR